MSNTYWAIILQQKNWMRCVWGIIALRWQATLKTPPRSGMATIWKRYGDGLGAIRRRGMLQKRFRNLFETLQERFRNTTESPPLASDTVGLAGRQGSAIVDGDYPMSNGSYDPHTTNSECKAIRSSKLAFCNELLQRNKRAPHGELSAESFERLKSVALRAQVISFKFQSNSTRKKGIMFMERRLSDGVCKAISGAIAILANTARRSVERWAVWGSDS